MSKKKPEKWTVYMHIVPKEINADGIDKYYIGITRKTVYQRWARGQGYKTQAFYNAIEKYGWDNIRHEVVATNLKKDDAMDLERLLIFMYQSNDKKHGYNIAVGGQGDDMTDETKEKLTQISKAKWQDPQYVHNVTSNLKRGADHPLAKKVALLNTGEIFDCEYDIQRKYGVNQEMIHKYCKGKNTCEKKDNDGNNLVFRWYEDYINMSSDEISSLIEHDTRYCNRIKHKKPFVCVNTGETFEYMFEAEDKYGINRDHVSNCCKGKGFFSGRLPDGTKLAWAYLSDYNKMSEKDKLNLIEKANTPPKKYKCRKIVDILSNKVYKSITQCASAVGINRHIIGNVMRNTNYLGGRYKDRFVFLDDLIKDSNEILDSLEFVE